jgi:hypothetical protein
MMRKLYFFPVFFFVVLVFDFEELFLAILASWSD